MSTPEAGTFRNQLDGLSARFVADFKRRDALACAEAYTEDALILLSKVAPIRGKKEIAAAFAAAMEAGQEIFGLTTNDERGRRWNWVCDPDRAQQPRRWHRHAGTALRRAWRLAYMCGGGNR
jgi:hypothetical protein